MEDFQEHFETYSDKKLMEMLLSHTEYKQEAIEAAWLLLKKRGKTEEARTLLEGKIKAQEQEAQEKRTKAQEHYEKLKTIDFGKHISFPTGSAAQLEFERQLCEAEIPYHMADGFNYTQPVIRFFVAEEDFEHALWLHGHIGTEKMQEAEKLPEYKPVPYAHVSVVMFFVLLAVVLGLWF